MAPGVVTGDSFGVSDIEKAEAASEPRVLAQAKAQPVRGARYWVKRIVIDAVVLYVLLCLFLFLAQKRFIYHRGGGDAMAPQEHGFNKIQARALQAQASDGVTIGGWHLTAGRRTGGDVFAISQAPLVDLFFCGNAGTRGDRTDIFRRLTAMGVEVVCFDYRGYGDSGGSPSEEGLAQDARAAWDFLRKEGVKPECVVIHGESLGGAVAVRLAQEMCQAGTPPAGLIVQASFARMQDVAQKHFWFVPVGLILTERFPSVERMPQVTCPLLQLHGARDEIVPFEQGKLLFAAAPAQSAKGIEKQFVELPDCGHNDIGVVNGPAYKDALAEFVETISPTIAAERAKTEQLRAAAPLPQRVKKAPPRRERPKP